MTIENDAPANSLYIKTGSGNVGLGTSNPLAELHIFDPSKAIPTPTGGVVFVDGNATVRLVGQPVFSLGTPPAGVWNLTGAPTQFIISDSANSTFPFRIATAAPDDSLVIDSVGQVSSSWVGVNDAGDGLMNLMTLSSDNSSATRSSDEGFALRNTRAGFQWNFRTAETAAGFMATKQGSGGAELEIKNATNDYTQVSLLLGNGARCTSTGQWINASSRQYKENIRALGADEAMAAFRQLTPVSYNFRKDPAREQNIGFIAEEVPELVAVDDRKGINTIEVVALLTRVVQEQQKTLAEQQRIIAELREAVQGKAAATASPAEAAAGPVPFARRAAHGI